MTVVADWKSAVMAIVSQFNPKDVFNCDETGLFWRGLPTKSLTMRGEECKGGEKAKERVSVLLASSVIGEKLPLLVINKAFMPRVFKKTLPLGILWHANSKAWMTGSIFGHYCFWLNKRMSDEGRKNWLLLDNAPCHVVPESMLTHVKVVFLPANTTCETQPLDAGIIKNFKVKYRKRLLEYMLALIDDYSENSAHRLLKQVDMKLAVEWMKMAWSEVSEDTIRHCFGHVGIFSRPSVNEAVYEWAFDQPVQYGETFEASNDDDECREIVDMMGVIGVSSSDICLEENVPAFDTITTSWESAIFNPDPGSKSEDDEDEVEVAPPTAREVLAAVQQIQSWGRHVSADLHRELHGIRVAIANHRRHLPNGTLDTWLNNQRSQYL
ncbi:hypothetical protein Ae201684P_010436 [Aphanomyces euteiches]|nr:hypothetical protein Ae201684P_010436 [Aphanomyces euteiches]